MTLAKLNRVVRVIRALFTFIIGLTLHLGLDNDP